ncbi:MAG: SDR family oxidoreductase [Firmicutes bacterium]|nr:SDR family oxidoreductase [Bacillota bacterium]
MNIQGKRVFISGSSRGIGFAIAKKFAENGACVLLNGGKDKAGLEKAWEEIKNINPGAEMYFFDVSDYDECKEAFEKMGDIDILINNAGISHLGLFTDMKPEEWKRVIDVNLISVMNCTHLALPNMIRKKSGVIINISSMWGDRGASCEAAYSASKGGINAFTKAMAKEVGPSGIRVNAVACGVIETKMNEWISQEERQVLMDEISLERFGKPEEIGDLVLFLASDRASYINGQIITADGGMY